MLCSVCNKNVAVIFVNKEGTRNGYCLDCAKEKGIDPMQAMMDQLSSSNSSFDMSNLTEQLDKFMSNLDPDQLEALQSSPFASFSVNPENGNVNLNEEELNERITKKTVKEKKKKQLSLDIYGVNLTQKAKLNELDKVIGRDKELDRVIQILNRRTKNNPALIGEPGVGKTALVSALAIKIADGSVPAKLQDKQVYLLDMTSLVAGTQFRGQFESRVKTIIEECRENKNIILAIDEVHSIVGGQEHDNSMNAANMLKPALANGYVQLIGATTLKEYRKYIEKDTALERRFQSVMIDEPTEKDAVKILKGIKKYYEDYHKVLIPDTTVEKAVELSVKYIHDRFLPDKAIDLLDEAASRVNLDNNILAEATKLSFKIAALEKKLKEYEEETVNDSTNELEEHYEKVATLKAEISRYQDELDILNDNLKPHKVTEDHLAQVIELWTKIPVARITTSSKQKILNLENNLKKKIIGQDKAIKEITNAIMRKKAGIQNIIKPPSFIFVGPTGVGKTALVKALAYELFDNENQVIKLDMSEYSESHSTSKLIGSPPGYVGYDEAGQLTEKVRRNPYSIILFDEIEKAHSSIYNVLLQILDEGKLTDSQGKSVSFKHTIIIMTSNLGTNFKNDSYGFNTSESEAKILTSKINDSLKDFFTPEFLNRIDEIISFNKLNKDNIIEITNIMINDFLKETSKKGYMFKVTNDVSSFVANVGYSPRFGARELRRAIQRYIEDFIALKAIKDEIKIKKEYTIDIKDNEITLV